MAERVAPVVSAPDVAPGNLECLADLCTAVRPTDSIWIRRAHVRQLTLARTPQSLGELDRLIRRIAAMRRTSAPGALAAGLSVLGADHGVARHATSVYRQAVSGRILALAASGRAPVNILAARVPAAVHTADFGLATASGDERYRVAAGTGDISREDAMTNQQAHTAVLNGARYAAEALGGFPLVGVGEIGVGNTTAMATLAARLLDLPPDSLVGRGTGIDDEMLQRKRILVRQALKRTEGRPADPMALLAMLGGFEIAGNVGVILALAARRAVIVIDGAITAVSALIALRLCPPAGEYLIAAHRSSEPAHGALLKALSISPLLDLDLRLGMGSGAALALGLVNAALAVGELTPEARSVGLGSSE